MDRNNIKTIIRELFSTAFAQYPETFKYSFAYQTWAEDLWEIRDEQEIERDAKAGVVKGDYTVWAAEMYKELTGK